MYSFIAITAHYIIKDENEIYRLRHRLIGFEYLPGSHSGERIAQSLFAVYISLGITHRVSSNWPISSRLTCLEAWSNHYG